MFKFVVTDLAAGKWQVLKNGESYLKNFAVTEKEGILYFEGQAAEYQFVKY
jgi:hypothetical protein